MLFYNVGIWLLVLAVRIASLFDAKARLWVMGRRDIFRKLTETIPARERVIWIHASSLGEFEQGRPLMEAIRSAHPGFRILLTFFSPSGYEVRKNYEGADYVFYLPADTPAGARRFLDIVHPEIAIFIKYEFWLNYLCELNRRGCRTFVVSAIFRHDSVFFKWYGGVFRKALRTFEHIFVQDGDSKELLAELGIGNVTVAGDTRFDRVAAIAEAAPRIEVAERFARGAKVLVAGSTWMADEETLLSVMENHSELKFIIVPHEIDSHHIAGLADRMGAVRYTECTDDTPLENKKVLIVDTIGLLSSLYRYGWAAYIGGGFGVGIHNTLEAVAFGLPVAFGPNYGKFKEARDMVEQGIATSVDNAAQLDAWIAGLEDDGQKYDRTKLAAVQYVARNRGATQTIMQKLFG